MAFTKSSSKIQITDNQVSNQVDYSKEVIEAKNPILKYLWMFLGFFFTILGFLGYILPLLPGTVFILIAVYFFAKSNAKLYNWLLNNRVFGQGIRDFRAGLGIPLKIKILAVSMIIFSIGSSSIFFTHNWYLRLIMALTGLTISTYIITRKTKNSI